MPELSTPETLDALMQRVAQLENPATMQKHAPPAPPPTEWQRRNDLRLAKQKAEAEARQDKLRAAIEKAHADHEAAVQRAQAELEVITPQIERLQTERATVVAEYVAPIESRLRPLTDSAKELEQIISLDIREVNTAPSKGSPYDHHHAARAAHLSPRRNAVLVFSGPGSRRLHADRDATERLDRHGEQIRVLRAEQERRAWQGIRAGELETRIEPNRTDGQGGYFAPPLWMNEFFATAARPGRVLAGLVPHFDLPPGVGSVSLPIITTGTSTQATIDATANIDQDIMDTAGTSTVQTISGQADVSLQLLEQSPAGASLDWAILTDLSADYDQQLESTLLLGAGSIFGQVTGVVSAATNSVTYSSGSPSATAMWMTLARCRPTSATTVSGPQRRG